MSEQTMVPTLAARLRAQAQKAREVAEKAAAEQREEQSTHYRKRNGELLATRWKALTDEALPAEDEWWVTAKTSGEIGGVRLDEEMALSCMKDRFSDYYWRLLTRCSRGCGEEWIRTPADINTLADLPDAFDRRAKDHPFPGWPDEVDEEGDPKPGTRFYRERKATTPTMLRDATIRELLAELATRLEKQADA